MLKRVKRILMVGLDGAGQQTILYKLKLGNDVTTIRTIGLKVEYLQYQNIHVLVWDVGGQDETGLRSLPRNYLINTQAVIFVVNCNDRDRVEEARDELHGMLRVDELQDASLLVFANKHVHVDDSFSCFLISRGF